MTAPMLVVRSKTLLRALLVASVCMSVLTGAFALRHAGGLASGATRAEVEQKSLRLQPAFRALCERLRAALPPDAGVLLEPSRLEPLGLSPQARWHLLFNYELAPLRCYTREPAAASGTLVDWPRWIERHFAGSVFAPERALAPIPPDVLERALAERRIQWRITYPQGGALATSDVRLWRRESGMWKPVQLPDRSAPPQSQPLRSLLAACATAASLGVLGCGVLRACARRRCAGSPAGGPVDWLELASDGLALGLVLGGALVLGVCWLRGAELSLALGRALLIAAPIVGSVAVWFGARGSHATVRCATGEHANATRARWTFAERALAALCVLFCAYALLQAYGVPLHRFDSTQHFAYKGRLLLSEGLATAGWTDVTEPVGRIVTHPSYPPLLGAWTALCSCVVGAFDADAGKLLVALFVPLGALWLFRWLRWRSRVAGLLAALSWSALPFLYYAWQPSADATQLAWLGLLFGEAGAARLGLAGYADPFFSDLLDGTGDLPLAALALGAALALRELARVPERRAVLVPALAALLAGMALVKNEGLPLAALLLVGGVALAPRAVPPRALGAALALACVLFAPWWFAKRHVPSIDENYGVLLRPSNLLANAERASVVALEYASSFARVLRWNLLWPLCALASIVAALAWRRADGAWRHDTRLLALALLGALALYFAVLLVTPWDLATLFSTFIPDRLFVHVAPLALAFVFGAAWPREVERS